jgi:hypothetical protein
MATGSGSRCMSNSMTPRLPVTRCCSTWMGGNASSATSPPLGDRASYAEKDAHPAGGMTCTRHGAVIERQKAGERHTRGRRRTHSETRRHTNTQHSRRELRFSGAKNPPPAPMLPPARPEMQANIRRGCAGARQCVWGVRTLHAASTSRAHTRRPPSSTASARGDRRSGIIASRYTHGACAVVGAGRGRRTRRAGARPNTHTHAVHAHPHPLHRRRQL